MLYLYNSASNECNGIDLEGGGPEAPQRGLRGAPRGGSKSLFGGGPRPQEGGSRGLLGGSEAPRGGKVAGAPRRSGVKG